jgi:hypothetical protein
MFPPAFTPVKGGVTFNQNQSGQALMTWVLMMLYLFAGLSTALAGYAYSSVKTTQRSTDFVVAGQLSNEAVQDAIYQFNEGDIAKFNDDSDPEPGVDPFLAGTDCGDIEGAIKRDATWKIDKLGCGEYQSAPEAGKWQWTVEDVYEGNIESQKGKRFTVTATGAYGDAKRSVTVNLTSIAATGVRYDENNKIGYSIAPSTAFDFAIFGGSDKDGEGVSWAKGPKNTDNVYVEGEIGSNNLIDINHIPSTIDSTSPETFKNYTSPANDVPSVGFYNYGTKGWDERCNTTTALEQTKTACQPILRAPQKMVLNNDLVNALADKCVGSPYKWVASEQDGILNAGAGNAGCYTEMVFDRDVNVVGTNFFSAFVRGNVTINPGVNIKTMNPANLVIYTSGNVSLNTGAGSTGVELDMFVYAPTGTCELKDSIADMSPVKVVGSLACNNVILEGVAVEWKEAPAGVDQPGFSDPTAPTYSKRIWNADNIIEGQSGRIS